MNINLVQKTIKKYLSYNPKHVGKFGCYWIDSSSIDWFDETFLVKTVILQITEESWAGSPFSINAVPRGQENMFYDMDFCRNNSCFIPYGFYILVHNDNHFDSLIMQKPFDSPFFWTGNDLPDILYEHLCIDRDKWLKMDLEKVHEFNVEIMRSKQDNNYLKKISTTSISVKLNPEQAFESSVPSQNLSYTPLCLAWDCLMSAVSDTNSDFDRTIYKDCFTDKNWGVLKNKISPEIFAQSLCLDLKQTFYDHHMPWDHLKKTVREDEEYSKNKIIQKDC